MTLMLAPAPSWSVSVYCPIGIRWLPTFAESVTVTSELSVPHSSRPSLARGWASARNSSSVLDDRGREAVAIAFQGARNDCLTGAFFLVAEPAQRAHVAQRRLQCGQVQVAQLDQLVAFIEQPQAAAPPIRGRDVARANPAHPALVPGQHQALHVLRRGIELGLAFLAAVALFRPAGARLQSRVFLAAQRRPEGVLVVHLEIDARAVFGADGRLAAAVLVVILQAH